MQGDWRRHFDEGYERGCKLVDAVQPPGSEHVDPLRDPFRLGWLLYLVRSIVSNSSNFSRDQNVALSDALLDAEHAVRRRIAE